MQPNETMLKIALDNWHSTLKRTNDVISSLNDEQMMREVSPGRNRGVYLLGHLVAVHEAMLPLLGLGEASHPGLLETFIRQPDNKAGYDATLPQLRKYWNDVNETLNSKFASLTPDQWLDKHTSVSAEDFAREPHRNRLNVLASRTTHLASHYGQLLFLKGKDE